MDNGFAQVQLFTADGRVIGADGNTGMITHDDASTHSFDYSALPPDQAQRTQDAEYRIIGRTQKTIVENGRDLLAVKQDIGHGHFLNWMRSMGIDERTAQRWMNVAENFGEIRPSDVFEKHALYLLSSPKTPESARQEARERAASGEEITEAVARQIRDAHKAKEQAEIAAKEASNQLSLFQASAKEEQEQLTQRINDLQIEIQTLTTPEQVEVIPDETKKQLQKLEKEVAALTQQKANLSKLNDALSTELKGTERMREQERRDEKKRQDWCKGAEFHYKAMVKFLGTLPTPVDAQVFDSDGWERLDDLIAITERSILVFRTLRNRSSTAVIDSD